VFIFGKHLDETKLLKTDDEEIKEMIRISEVDCTFYNIADKSIEDINKIIDELITVEQLTTAYVFSFQALLLFAVLLLF